MDTADLTIEILKDIRAELRAMRESTQGFQTRQEAFNERQEAFNERQEAFNQEAMQRFSAIEEALRDSAEQMVMHARAVRILLESKGEVGGRVEELERRVSVLELRAQ